MADVKNIKEIISCLQEVGVAAIEASKAKRAYSLIQYLPEMRKKIKKLEKRLDSHEEAGR